MFQTVIQTVFQTVIQTVIHIVFETVIQTVIQTVFQTVFQLRKCPLELAQGPSRVALAWHKAGSCTQFGTTIGFLPFLILQN